MNQTTDDEVVENALEAMREYIRQTELLAEKLLGKTALQHGRAIPDLWSRRQWYMHRIFDLGSWAGENEQRMRRCKRTDGTAWKHYQKAGYECRQVADHLMLEVQKL